MKPIALSNVRMLYTLLRERGRGDIDIVGVGAVYSGKDAFELILCGASAVQVGTCHWTEGSACFSRIANELGDIMSSKGYSSIQDFKGKLKPFVNSKSTPKGEEPKNDLSTTVIEKKSFGLQYYQQWLYFQAIVIIVLSLLLARFYFPNF